MRIGLDKDGLCDDLGLGVRAARLPNFAKAGKEEEAGSDHQHVPPPFFSCLGDATRRLDFTDGVHALDAQVSRALTFEAVACIQERRRTGGASAWPHACQVVMKPVASARVAAAAHCPHAHCIRKDSHHDLTHLIDVQ